jgi:hypothetical protein
MMCMLSIMCVHSYYIKTKKEQIWPQTLQKNPMLLPTIFHKKLLLIDIFHKNPMLLIDIFHKKTIVTNIFCVIVRKILSICSCQFM